MKTRGLFLGAPAARTGSGISRIIMVSMLIFIGSALLLGQDSGDYFVIGWAVDANGQSVSGAGICVEPVVDRSTAFDSFIKCVSTEPDGSFSIRKFGNQQRIGKKHYLYAYVDSTDPEVMSVITPPFRSIQQSDKAFKGKLVKFGLKRKLDVSDIEAQFWYGRARLEFLEYGVGKKSKPIDWAHINLKRNKDGRVVEYKTLSRDQQKKYIRNNGGELNVSLPEGHWKVEILEFDTKRILSQSPYFDIKRNSSQNVVMTK